MPNWQDPDNNLYPAGVYRTTDHSYIVQYLEGTALVTRKWNPRAERLTDYNAEKVSHYSLSMTIPMYVIQCFCHFVETSVFGC